MTVFFLDYSERSYALGITCPITMILLNLNLVIMLNIKFSFYFKLIFGFNLKNMGIDYIFKEFS
jgi:hypothetical protein